MAKEDISYEDCLPEGFVLSFAVIILIAIYWTVQGYIIEVMNPIGFIIFVFIFWVICGVIVTAIVYFIRKHIIHK